MRIYKDFRFEAAHYLPGDNRIDRKPHSRPFVSRPRHD